MAKTKSESEVLIERVRAIKDHGELQRLYREETTGKGRKTVLEALEARFIELKRAPAGMVVCRKRPTSSDVTIRTGNYDRTFRAGDHHLVVSQAEFHRILAPTGHFDHVA